MDNYTYILGPCSIENEDNFLEVAKTLDGWMGTKEWYLKGSFDKANRTSIHSDRGPGLEEGMEIMRTVKHYYPDIKMYKNTSVLSCKHTNKLSYLCTSIL